MAKIRDEKWPDADVEAIYQAYPRHVGKDAAFKAIGKALSRIKLNGSEDAVIWLLLRVKEYARSPAGQQGQYTPHPSTWFNQGRYYDNDLEWTRTGTVSGPGRVEADSGKYDRFD
jgi:hypothetical protein